MLYDISTLICYLRPIFNAQRSQTSFNGIKYINLICIYLFFIIIVVALAALGFSFSSKLLLGL